MSGWGPDREEDSATAAEYVLGLLAPEELALAERRLAEDAAFRELVRDWTEQLATLTDDIPAVEPPKALQAQLFRRLFPEEERRPGLLGRWGIWPLLLGGAVAAGLAVLALNPGLLPRGTGAADYAARIAAQDESLVVEARFDQDTGRLEVRRTAGDVPEGRDYELWLVHDDTTTSLGVLPREELGVIEVRADLIPEFENNALALSEEPLGGSPTGQATGEVVAVGTLTGL